VKRGPRPLPQAVKASRGTLRKCRTNPNEPQLPPAHSLDPPATLKGEGLAEWHRLVPSAWSDAVLRDADVTMFRLYCETLSDLEGYQKLARKGRDLAIISGSAGQVYKLRNQARQLAAELGLTPSSRSGVKAIEAKPPGKLEQFIRRVK
jgi:P27 family predicted phage terminase small subunit